MDKSIEEIARILGGELISPVPQEMVTGVSTDSRKIRGGDLFFALKGPNFDGHGYAEDACRKGAVGAVISQPAAGIPGILVEDTLKALQRLAAYHRSQFDVPVLAVTGSVGKTTTKDLLAACLEGSLHTLKTSGNFNNEIGLPLTLLQLKPEHQACVVELAMRGPGQIAELAEIARPTGSIIVNVAPVHLETMGNLTNVAQAKCEVLEYTKKFAILHYDSSELRNVARFNGEALWFGTSPECDWQLLGTGWDGTGTNYNVRIGDFQGQLYLPVPAPHLGENLLAAAGTAMLMGVDFKDIALRLRSFKMSSQRLQVLKGVNGSIVIDDSYNANPKSMEGALMMLAEMARGRRTIAILGDMFELGPDERDGHCRTGQTAARLGINLLLTVGTRSRYIKEGAKAAGFKGIARQFENKETLAEFLEQELSYDDIVLVKASRGMKMESLVKALTVLDKEPY